MNIPAEHDFLWIALPGLAVACAVLVYLREKANEKSNQRAALRAVAHVLFPIVELVAWLAFRAYERRSEARG